MLLDDDLKPEHVVETKGNISAYQAMIAKEAAGRIADQDVGAYASRFERLWLKGFANTPMMRAIAGDGDRGFRDFLALV